MFATSLRIITIIVVTMAIASLFCIATLAYCLINNIQPDQILLTAFIGVTSSITGTLGGMLVNTRSSNGEPIQTTIMNNKSDPVPTVETD
jgi:hypothetical protein